MNQTPVKAEAPKGDERQQSGREKSSNAIVTKLFQEFMRDFNQLSTLDRMKRIGEILFAATIGRLVGAKEALGTLNGDKKTDESVNTPPAPTDSSALPQGLNGTKWTSENILKCNTIQECRTLMKKNGFILDEYSGNYVNPRYLSPDKILKEPLVEKDVGGKKIKLKQSVMARLIRADEKMFQETGEHIKPGEHFRSNEHQFNLFKKLKPQNARVAAPGNSFHEIGQAVDLPENWQKAQKYMWAEGFIGGKDPIGLAGDANHFSVGEIGMTSERAAALQNEGISLPKKAA